MKSSPLLLAAGVLAFAGCTMTSIDVRRRPVTAVAHFTIPHFEVSQVDVPPEPTNMVPPRLRIRNPGEGPDGYAVVDFIVDADGIPREVQWVEASDAGFARAAAASAAESRYSPAKLDGKAVAAKVAEYEGMSAILPPVKLCTDNAAMIAVAGTHAHLRGVRAGADLNAVTHDHTADRHLATGARLRRQLEGAIHPANIGVFCRRGHRRETLPHAVFTGNAAFAPAKSERYTAREDRG